MQVNESKLPGKQADRKFYLDMLRSDECLCERSKQPGRTFCYRCYKALPHDMQKDLYQRMGAGYEEAVEAACAWLQTEGW